MVQKGVEINKKEFLCLLSQSWKQEGERFTKEENKEYLKWLDYLQSNGDLLTFEKKEILEIYRYLEKSIRNYIKLSIAKKQINHNHLIEIHNLCFIMEYFFSHHNELIPERLVSRLLYLIMDIHDYDAEELAFLMQFYKESRLFDQICYYLFYFYNFKCSLQILNSFLTRIDFTQYHQVFLIIFHQINPLLTNRNMKGID